jgi:hypothetical protein
MIAAATDAENHQSRAVGDFDTTSRLGEIGCPTLVLVARPRN